MSVSTSRIKGASAATAYEVLHRDIMLLRLAPGTVLDESSLSARLSMSRAPLREALIRLNCDGLVISLPNRSSMVAALELASLPGFFDAFSIMLRMSARLAAERQSGSSAITEALAAYVRACAKTTAVEPALAVLTLQGHIANAGRNQHFISFSGRLMAQAVRLLVASGAVISARCLERLVVAVTSGRADVADEAAAFVVAEFRSLIMGWLSTDAAIGVDLTKG